MLPKVGVLVALEKITVEATARAVYEGKVPTHIQADRCIIIKNKVLNFTAFLLINTTLKMLRSTNQISTRQI